MRTITRYLGVMRGGGSLACDGQSLGRVEYEIEGFLKGPGEVVGSARSAWRRPSLTRPLAVGICG